MIVSRSAKRKNKRKAMILIEGRRQGEKSIWQGSKIY
jgi:hypothetical protein